MGWRDGQRAWVAVASQSCNEMVCLVPTAAWHFTAQLFQTTPIHLRQYLVRMYYDSVTLDCVSPKSH